MKRWLRRVARPPGDLDTWHDVKDEFYWQYNHAVFDDLFQLQQSIETTVTDQWNISGELYSIEDA